MSTVLYQHLVRTSDLIRQVRQVGGLCVLILESHHQKTGEKSISKNRMSFWIPKVLYYGQLLTIYLCIQNWLLLFNCPSWEWAQDVISNEPTPLHKPHIIQLLLQIQHPSLGPYLLVMIIAAQLALQGLQWDSSLLPSMFLQWHAR